MARTKYGGPRKGAVSVRKGPYYRERGSKGGRTVPALDPTPDPPVTAADECRADERYNRGGLVSGGIKLTGNPKDTP